jgi:hypothetical protein
MIIIDSVALGDVACTRASPKWVFDRNGTLVQVQPNTLAVTYDPQDLNQAPYALVDLAAATNFVSYSSLRESSGVYAILGPSVVDGGVIAGSTGPDGVAGARRFTVSNPDGLSTVRFGDTTAGTPGTAYFGSIFVRTPDGVARTLNVDCCDGAVQVIQVTGAWQRVRANSTPSNPMTYRFLDIQFGSSGDYEVFGAQISDRDSEYIPNSTNGPVTRAADVIASGAGLVYSNVAINEQPYSAATSYAKDAVVYDPVTHLTYKSVVAANVGNALSDSTKWTKGDVINRWKMLDQYNNTQTSNLDEILLVVSPEVISQGFYLGNMDAGEVRASVVDLYEGMVYREVQNLVVSTSGSSFFNWCFRRIRKKSYAVSVLMPVYARALITISIRKIGATPKCGMCAIGPVVDVGLSEWGISTEIKDYSTTTFQFDGTSDTQLRGFSRRMSVDVEVDNDQKDVVEETLAQFRQKPVAWIGTVLWGSACLFGRYSSFKSVLPNVRKSKISLQIEGTVQ